MDRQQRPKGVQRPVSSRQHSGQEHPAPAGREGHAGRWPRRRAEPAKAQASAPKVTGKDKQLEEKKKQAETAEAEKKKAEEEKVAKVRADNCARAKRAKADMDSGVRIARTNDKGEREVMDDAARAVESKRLEGIVASDCKPAG